MPTGTFTGSLAAKCNGHLRPSQYSRMAEGIERVNQYSERVVSSSSCVNREPTSPLQSFHERNLSTIHAARPAGE